MGAYPSVSSVPSTAIAQDIIHLKRLFPDKFLVEQIPSSNSVALVSTDGKLTLILVDITTKNGSDPEEGAGDGGSYATALVMNEGVIQQVNQRQAASTTMSDFVAADIVLPGGSTLLLISPAAIGLNVGRQKLAQRLEACMTTTNIAKPMNGQHPQDQPNGTNNNEISTSTTTSTNDNPSSTNITSSPFLPPLELQNLPSFPTLDFRLLQKGGYLQPNFPLNSRTGVPFDTELFQGKALFLLRPMTDPATEDPYWNERIFAHKQRRVIVQVQGKFKYKPQGILYAGGEISEPMKLGLVAKG